MAGTTGHCLNHWVVCVCACACVFVFVFFEGKHPFGSDPGGGVNFTHRWPLNVPEKAACGSVDPEATIHLSSDTQTHKNKLWIHTPPLEDAENQIAIQCIEE